MDKIRFADSVKRFRYLLGLTDLFRHFIDLRAKQDVAFNQVIQELDADGDAPVSKSKNKAPSRKTEKEEDAELLNDEVNEQPIDYSRTIFTESPRFVQGGTLREYQIQGLNWLIALHENRISGILADEMGLGKTLQTISFLGYLRYVRNLDGPHIVIVPKSTLDNWNREFAKWTPAVKTLVLQGDKVTRQDLITNRLLTADFDVCITTFEIVIREKAQLKKIAWQYIIVDEAHRIKNEDSMLSQIIRLFHSRNRLLITGTPLQNNLHELWALLNFLLPDVFAESDVFDQWFENRDESDKDDTSIIQQLHKVLRPFLLRRVKSDVEKSLLPKKEMNLYIGMSAMQSKWYQKLLEKDLDAVNGQIGKREGKTRLLNIVMQLRKCCNHPYLFDGAEPGPPYTTDEHLVYNCGKMIILDKLLKRFKAQGSRVLIFSQMSRMLDILEDYALFRQYEYSRIDGSTLHEDRIQAIDDFNSPKSDKFVFLLTTRAGGLGINLTTADIVILYDSDWNPQADLQAMDRAHRIGQTKQVYVYRFITENAIEEKVLDRAAQKLRLDQLVIQQGRTLPAPNDSTNQSGGSLEGTATTGVASKDELLRMIQHGAEAVFKQNSSTANGGTGGAGTITDDIDIDAILQHGHERTQQLNQKFQKLGIDELQNFTSDSSAYEWNGEDFSRKNVDNDDNNDNDSTNDSSLGIGGYGGSNSSTLAWINPAKRERKEQTYSVDNYYKDILQQTKASQQIKTPRAPKQIHPQDHQMFDERLMDLQDLEMAYYRKQIGFKVTSADIDLDSLEEGETKDGRRRRENKLIEIAEPLTPEQEAEKQRLIEQGFGNWTRRDFTNFIHASAKYGRNNFEPISREFDESKPLEEIKRYAKAFWSSYKTIEGYEKYLAQIEAGEKRASKLNHQAALLRRKIEQYRVPMQEMKIHYPANNSKRSYTEEEDRFILLTVDSLGLYTANLWEKVHYELKKSPYFRFDWFFLSRTPVELSRRCTTLLLAVTREFEGPDAMKRKSGPKYSRNNTANLNTPTNAATATPETMTANNSPNVSDSEGGTPTPMTLATTPTSAPLTPIKSHKRGRKTRTEQIKSAEVSSPKKRKKAL
ncbi:hypothetical protein NADFUDRAFT_20910 [Nadsonia fulvescens var. elongata DSM 6958]|uniref:Chromatin remodelling complex ATPase chain ISW1 n=1 Tax=Nadsonia fulvescens var. elongata DSM 6958 TaxID=857566 RepID=A0A1E3PRM6_9ASCO|nr:hypothetical protein NADFUDRAFT_20910 [Nadsonia fulvescens var. elongata DSM 6958]